MTFEYRDNDGARLRVANVNASTYYGNEPVVAMLTEHRDGDDVPVVYVPLDRVEEVIAGIRDAARQAAGQTPAQHVHKLGNPDDDGGILDDWDNCRDPECPGPAPTAVGEQAATQPATERAAVLREAADFVRDAHFRDGLTVQEIGTALRHMADGATS